MNYKWKLEPPTPEKLEAAERLAKELNIPIITEEEFIKMTED